MPALRGAGQLGRSLTARAREALLREFKTWGVSSGSDSQADAVLRQVLAESRPAGPTAVAHEVHEATDPLISS